MFSPANNCIEYSDEDLDNNPFFNKQFFNSLLHGHPPIIQQKNIDIITRFFQMKTYTDQEEKQNEIKILIKRLLSRKILGLLASCDFVFQAVTIGGIETDEFFFNPFGEIFKYFILLEDYTNSIEILSILLEQFQQFLIDENTVTGLFGFQIQNQLLEDDDIMIVNDILHFFNSRKYNFESKTIRVLSLIKDTLKFLKTTQVKDIVKDFLKSIQLSNQFSNFYKTNGKQYDIHKPNQIAPNQSDQSDDDDDDEEQKQEKSSNKENQIPEKNKKSTLKEKFTSMEQEGFTATKLLAFYLHNFQMNSTQETMRHAKNFFQSFQNIIQYFLYLNKVNPQNSIHKSMEYDFYIHLHCCQQQLKDKKKLIINIAWEYERLKQEQNFFSMEDLEAEGEEYYLDTIQKLEGQDFDEEQAIKQYIDEQNSEDYYKQYEEQFQEQTAEEALNVQEQFRKAVQQFCDKCDQNKK